MPKQEKMATLEVASQLDTGEVIISYRDIEVGPDGWGHVSFTVAQAKMLIETLQNAVSHICVNQLLDNPPPTKH